MLESGSFNIEQQTETRRWRAIGKNLIVLPQTPRTDHCDRVLDRLCATYLARPPAIEELDQFDAIISVDPGSPPETEHLKVQSLWLTIDSALINLAAVFPDLRKGVSNFQTLRGLLWPSQTHLHPDFNIDKKDSFEAWLRAIAPHQVWCLTSLLSPRKQAKTLEALIRPESKTHRLGIFGIGDIGTIVSAIIRSEDITRSTISDIFIGGSRLKEKVEAQILELEHLNIENVNQPRIHPVYPDEEDTFFKECDIILILVASDILPPTTPNGIDVRSEQYERNMRILREFISRATKKEYDGQILVGSDPIEQLTMGLYLAMKEQNWDINTHQFVGFGGMINRSRAKAMADRLGISSFQESGRVYGSHGKMVVSIPTHNARLFNYRQAEQLSLLTGHGNYEVRAKLAKPYLAPAVLMARGILDMHEDKGSHGRKHGGIIYASSFVPSDVADELGVFFGTRIEYHAGVGAWTPKINQPFLEQLLPVLQRAQTWVKETSYNPKTLGVDPFTEGANRHPAFHPYMLEQWFEKVTPVK